MKVGQHNYNMQNMSLSELSKSAKMQDGDVKNTKYVKASTLGKSLYTSGIGGAITNFLAKRGNTTAIAKQSLAREMGVTVLKNKLDEEFGQGMGKAVFDKLAKQSWNNSGGVRADFSKGVMIGDVDLLVRTAQAIKKDEEGGGNVQSHNDQYIDLGKFGVKQNKPEIENGGEIVLDELKIDELLSDDDELAPKMEIGNRHVGQGDIIDLSGNERSLNELDMFDVGTPGLSRDSANIDPKSFNDLLSDLNADTYQNTTEGKVDTGTLVLDEMLESLERSIEKQDKSEISHLSRESAPIDPGALDDLLSDLNVDTYTDDLDGKQDIESFKSEVKQNLDQGNDLDKMLDDLRSQAKNFESTSKFEGLSRESGLIDGETLDDLLSDMDANNYAETFDGQADIIVDQTFQEIKDSKIPTGPRFTPIEDH